MDPNRNPFPVPSRPLRLRLQLQVLRRERVPLRSEVRQHGDLLLRQHEQQRPLLGRSWRSEGLHQEADVSFGSRSVADGKKCDSKRKKERWLFLRVCLWNEVELVFLSVVSTTSAWTTWNGTFFCGGRWIRRAFCPLGSSLVSTECRLSPQTSPSLLRWAPSSSCCGGKFQILQPPSNFWASSWSTLDLRIIFFWLTG